MKRSFYILTLAVCVLLGFALAIGSTIGQGFISTGALAAVFYQTIQNAGTPVAQEPVLNFTSGVTCTDNPGVATNCAASAGSGFIQTLTAPVAASLTDYNFNTGSGVSTSQTNNTSPVTSITLVQNDPGVTQNIAAIGKNKLAATFTATVALSCFAYSQNFAGIWLSDGTNNLIFGTQGGNGLRASYFSSFSAYSGDVLAPQSSIWGTSPLMWMRIQETASARNYYASSDGITFVQLFTESNTAHFTTSQYGFADEVRNVGVSAQATLYSFTETNP